MTEAGSLSPETGLDEQVGKLRDICCEQVAGGRPALLVWRSSDLVYTYNAMPLTTETLNIQNLQDTSWTIVRAGYSETGEMGIKCFRIDFYNGNPCLTVSDDTVELSNGSVTQSDEEVSTTDKLQYSTDAVQRTIKDYADFENAIRDLQSSVRLGIDAGI